MGQKAKNAGIKKRSPKKEAIDRLSKQNTCVMIRSANYDTIRELTDIIDFGKPWGNRGNSKDIRSMITNKMAVIYVKEDAEALSKLW